MLSELQGIPSAGILLANIPFISVRLPCFDACCRHITGTYYPIDVRHLNAVNTGVFRCLPVCRPCPGTADGLRWRGEPGPVLPGNVASRAAQLLLAPNSGGTCPPPQSTLPGPPPLPSPPLCPPPRSVNCAFARRRCHSRQVGRPAGRVPLPVSPAAGAAGGPRVARGRREARTARQLIW